MIDTEIHDANVVYVQNALKEAKALHDRDLIEPTLRKFHIERGYVSFRDVKGTTKRLLTGGGFKPRPYYVVLDTNGVELGEPISEGDLGRQFSAEVIDKKIQENLEAMLKDHALLVAHHSGGDGGAAPNFQYKPGSGLSERSESIHELEHQIIKALEALEQLTDEISNEERKLDTLRLRKEAEVKRLKAEIQCLKSEAEEHERARTKRGEPEPNAPRSQPMSQQKRPRPIFLPEQGDSDKSKDDDFEF